MYGFPLTTYLRSGCLQSAYPGVDRLTHDAGHLLEMLFGLQRGYRGVSAALCRHVDTVVPTVRGEFDR